ncbi:transposase [Burkholderia sp. IT-111MI5]
MNNVALAALRLQVAMWRRGAVRGARSGRRGLALIAQYRADRPTFAARRFGVGRMADKGPGMTIAFAATRARG